MPRRTSIHDIKRRLIREMTRANSGTVDHVARQIRAHACACAFTRGRTLSSIENDTDLAGGWDASTLESELRSRLTPRR